MHDKLAELAGQAIIDALSKLEQGALVEEIQNSAEATYAAKLNKTEAQLNWLQNAEQISRAIRAYNPFPGAYTTINGTTIKIWQANEIKNASEIENSGERPTEKPGTVLEVNKTGIKVACGHGILQLEKLQKPGSKVMPAHQFTQGFNIKVGDRFTSI